MLLEVAAVAAAVYVCVLAALFAVMHQPPRVCGKVLSFIPGPAFMLFPMETMWCEARKGTLTVGQPAPDFTLRAREGGATVRLSSFRGSKPVVLVFGSYT
jgi:hypothetical protein